MSNPPRENADAYRTRMEITARAQGYIKKRGKCSACSGGKCDCAACKDKAKRQS
jgi:hypothetical protein